MFCTGGNEGNIVGWDSGYKLKFKIDMRIICMSFPGIRSLDCSKAETEKIILVGTRGSEVLVVNTWGELIQTVV
jgi:hypothetical protein